MNGAFISLVMAGSFVFAAVAMLFLSGQLIRADLGRAAAGSQNARRFASRIMEDLRPLQDLVVEFFGRSEYCAGLLKVLVRHEEPVTLSGALKKIPLQVYLEHTNSPPTHELAGVALFIMGLGGLVRLGWRGISVTKVGREVQRRLERPVARNFAEERPRLSPHLLRPAG
jgi:hypothetical protein